MEKETLTKTNVYVANLKHIVNDQVLMRDTKRHPDCTYEQKKQGWSCLVVLLVAFEGSNLKRGVQAHLPVSFKRFLCIVFDYLILYSVCVCAHITNIPYKTHVLRENVH